MNNQAPHCALEHGQAAVWTSLSSQLTLCWRDASCLSNSHAWAFSKHRSGDGDNFRLALIIGPECLPYTIRIAVCRSSSAIQTRSIALASTQHRKGVFSSAMSLRTLLAFHPGRSARQTDLAL